MEARSLEELQAALERLRGCKFELHIVVAASKLMEFLKVMQSCVVGSTVGGDGAG